MKSFLNLFGRVLIVTVGMLLLMELAGRIIYGGFGALFSTAGIDHLGTKLLFNLLISAALVYPVTHTRLRGWQLFVAIAVVYFGLGVFLTMIEAIVFLTQSATDIFRGFANGIVQTVVLAGLMTWVFKDQSMVRSDARGRENQIISRWAWIRIFALCAVCYTVLYLVAGFLIFQHVSEFYATQDAPFTEGMVAAEAAMEATEEELGDSLEDVPLTPALFFPFQLFRGACYVAFVLMLLRSLQGSRWQVALAMAFLFPMVAGVASLIVPNDFMPAGVRHIHMVEIGWSNFVYGLLVGFVFFPKKKRPEENTLT